ncbi:hypothetical protein VK792_05610 [Mesobacterium sp. TK19101]|uniref:C-type lysozyme inhibitor domain-containing protein n=1 Tax=Mesobacterium hydrothermale TaxID=3111907 RepID=A0ABU6HH07_9RHOB|nr:hypothetical protein [Mesobacterium sp. TK19101]MEC3860753.1 hypothetical protein [Mesobacterium sp. TK19101]
MRALILLLAIAPQLSQAAPVCDVLCTAVEQCRDDARSHCAPSATTICIAPRSGNKVHLYISGKGPYPARETTDGSARVLTLTAFGGGHVLTIQPDGQFLYLGNYSKRYTGQCAGSEDS